VEGLFGLIFVAVIVGLIYHSVTRCPSCNGSKVWTVSAKGPDGKTVTHKTGFPCPLCWGTGKRRRS
jgi:hypothetical protein